MTRLFDNLHNPLNTSTTATKGTILHRSDKDSSAKHVKYCISLSISQSLSCAGNMTRGTKKKHRQDVWGKHGAHAQWTGPAKHVNYPMVCSTQPNKQAQACGAEDHTQNCDTMIQDARSMDPLQPCGSAVPDSNRCQQHGHCAQRISSIPALQYITRHRQP